MNNRTVFSPLSVTVPLEFRWMPPPPRKVSQKERARHVPPLSPEEELADTIARQKEAE